MNISINKNTIIGDKSPLNPSGIRIGLCAMTTRGLNKTNCIVLAELIHHVIENAIRIQGDGCKLDEFKRKVDLLMKDGDKNLEDIKVRVYQFSELFHFQYKI